MEAVRAIAHFVTFRLGGETYALDVAQAREVVDKTTITTIPNTPSWVRGLLNLRGMIVPVLDIKRKFELAETADTKDTCIIIVELEFEGTVNVFGIMADSVTEVFEYDRSGLAPAPKFGGSVSAEFITGIGKINNKLFVVLDVTRVFASAGLSSIRVAGTAA